ncbi:bifunctional ADP-dependent NAD(P)H-hydrate dehydratase/NAD(P)H-hydrate epimerase [Arthrobacter sp. TMN-37]
MLAAKLVYMLKAFTAGQVRAAEEPLLAAGQGAALMQRAAHGLFAVAAGMLRDTGGLYGRTVVVLAGGGNNGADALYAAARLARRGMAATAVSVSGRIHPGALAAFTGAGGRLERLTPDNTAELAARCADADLILDGILGTGASGSLHGPPAALINAVNTLAGPRGNRRPRVLACDGPSGVDLDSGRVEGPVLRADATATFGAAKAGLLTGAGALAAGELNVIDIGLGLANGTAAEPAVRRLELSDAAALYRRPRATDHKYTRGVLGIAAGSEQYPGAAVLATGAALATGIGMVRYLGPRSVGTLINAVHPEAVCSTGGVAESRSQAWLVGPGAVGDPEQSRRARDAITSGLPVVVDAGALAEVPRTVGPQVILTPHAGELVALLSGRGRHVSREAIEASPAEYALETARLTGATVLLKGFTTVTAAPTGEVFSQADATPWLATAGAGDTLAGILGALAAAAAEDGAAAARAGVPEGAKWAAVAAAAALIHGSAAHRAARRGPVIVSELPAEIGAVIAGLLGAPD